MAKPGKTQVYFLIIIVIKSTAHMSKGVRRLLNRIESMRNSMRVKTGNLFKSNNMTERCKLKAKRAALKLRRVYLKLRLVALLQGLQAEVVGLDLN